MDSKSSFKKEPMNTIKLRNKQSLPLSKRRKLMPDDEKTSK